MRSLIVLSAVLGASTAVAQLPGVSLPPVSAGATGRADVMVRDPLPPVVDTTNRTVDRADRASARAAARADRVAARNRNAVRVDAGASLRVDRGTRCYYDDYYYDPYYRDGYYYCERRGTEARVTAGVGARTQ